MVDILWAVPPQLLAQVDITKEWFDRSPCVERRRYLIEQLIDVLRVVPTTKLLTKFDLADLVTRHPAKDIRRRPCSPGDTLPFHGPRLELARANSPPLAVKPFLGFVGHARLDGTEPLRPISTRRRRSTPSTAIVVDPDPLRVHAALERPDINFFSVRVDDSSASTRSSTSRPWETTVAANARWLAVYANRADTEGTTYASYETGRRGR